MLSKTILANFSKFIIGFSLFAILTLSGCNSEEQSNNTAAQSSMSVSLDLPDSMTGGRVAQVNAFTAAASQGTGAPCAFYGADEEDPFRNGYEMTKLMVSAIATWTCVADNLIIISNFEAIPHDGAIHETDNDRQASNYDPDDPTHYSVTDDSTSQVTIRLYYAYDRFDPPVPSTDPQFFISWNEAENAQINGRMIIDGLGVNKDKSTRKADDPTFMRMDFSFDEVQKNADMFLRFDEGNAWAEGFRILVTKDLAANPFTQVFTAKGLVEMKAQFVPVSGIDELPAVKMVAVSDSLGEGAAIAQFNDVSVALELNTTTQNHLGNYLFSKEDVYFFDANQASNQPWDWIYKNISTAQYRGGRTTPASGGSWIPFDPSLDLLESFAGLDLGVGYFNNTCNDLNTDCSVLFNAIHAYTDGFAGQEPNQGQDPQDWRSVAIANVTYLTSIYPNGINWDGAFDFVFIP